MIEPGKWNLCEVEVIDNTYTVRINGNVITSFTNDNQYRGKTRDKDKFWGFVGVQSHTGNVAFKQIRYTPGKPKLDVSVMGAGTRDMKEAAKPAERPRVRSA